MLINFGISKQNGYQSLGLSNMADEWLPVPGCIKHGGRMVTSAWVYQTWRTNGYQCLGVSNMAEEKEKNPTQSFLLDEQVGFLRQKIHSQGYR